MTDYLEALLEHTDVLLEQVRRLERSGGQTGPASPAQPSPPPRRERDTPSWQTTGAPELPSLGEWTAAKGRDARQSRARRARTLLAEEEDAGREPGEIPASPLAASPEREETVPPLLNQLKRLERTGVLPLGTASPGPEAGPASGRRGLGARPSPPLSPPGRAIPTRPAARRPIREAPPASERAGPSPTGRWAGRNRPTGSFAGTAAGMTGASISTEEEHTDDVITYAL